MDDYIACKRLEKSGSPKMKEQYMDDKLFFKFHPGTIQKCLGVHVGLSYIKLNKKNLSFL